jgi:hypothetical protein
MEIHTPRSGLFDPGWVRASKRGVM